MYKLPANETVKSKFGAAFDPFKNDQNFFLCMLALEELGATGNKGLIGLTTSPVIAAGIAGLATSATAHSAVEVRRLRPARDLLRGLPRGTCACGAEAQR